MYDSNLVPINAEMDVDDLSSADFNKTKLSASCGNNTSTYNTSLPRFELTFLNVAFKATFPNPEVMTCLGKIMMCQKFVPIEMSFLKIYREMLLLFLL